MKWNRKRRLALGFASLGVVCLVAAILWLRHPIRPTSESQRHALRLALEDTVRIEMRFSDHTPIVITNKAEIEHFAATMPSRWQQPVCLCGSLTIFRFVTTAGTTNLAEITHEYVRYGGPWATNVISSGWDAVPTPEAIELAADYSTIEKNMNAQPGH